MQAISYNEGGTVTRTITPEYGGYLRLWISGDVTIEEFQLEFGTASSEYEPYNSASTTIPISWQSSAGTVYGGTLDVTTGVLTVDRAMAVFNGSEAWTDVFPNWPTYGHAWYIALASVNSIITSDIYSKRNAHDYDFSVSIPWAGVIAVADSRYSSVSDFKAGLSQNNLHVLCKLATPQTYQLTPAEVTTLLGQNNIWTDCGPVSVEYPADTKLYIDKKLAALVAALS